MLSPEDLYALLERRRAELGMTQAEVSARAFGRVDNSPLQNIRRGSVPSAEKLEALAAALDLDFYFGPRRDQRTAVPGWAEAGGAAEFQAQNQTEAPKTVLLPWHMLARRSGQVSLSFSLEFLAGLPIPIDDMRLVAPVEVRLDWPLSQPALAIIEDPSVRRDGPSIWCYMDAFRPVIGRLQFVAGRTLVLGAGAADPVTVVEASDTRLSPLGRVVWLGGGT